MKIYLMLAAILLSTQQGDNLIMRDSETTYGNMVVFENARPSRMIMECEAMNPDLTVKGCKLENGGTLDAVVNQMISQLRQSQEEQRKTVQRFADYINTVQQTLNTINRPSRRHYPIKSRARHIRG